MSQSSNASLFLHNQFLNREKKKKKKKSGEKKITLSFSKRAHTRIEKQLLQPVLSFSSETLASNTRKKGERKRRRKKKKPPHNTPEISMRHDCVKSIICDVVLDLDKHTHTHTLPFCHDGQMSHRFYVFAFFFFYINIR
jgi:hypothetical protein